MKRRLHLIIYIVSILYCIPASAQDSNMRQVYEQAEEAYSIGRIEQAMTLLNNNIDNFQGGLKQSAYRLMALCNLGMDKTAEAEACVAALLNRDPYFTPSVQDPIRFADLVNLMKSGHAQTITTASKLAETVEDAPVPVTLITEDMIKKSTARNLLELLNDYVPGVNIVEGEESNFSMRGMFAYSQENVLIMLNGERLNSYCTNSIAPDYRIALNNIKQIEVLRGAASSLYGNVALSAVVNIITKSGSEADGLKASIGAGNMHTINGEFLFGKHYINSDLLIWGSIHSSHGYRHDIASNDPDDGYGLIPIDGYLYTNSYNNKPAFNIGLTYQWSNLSCQFSHSYGKRGYTYCNLFLPSTYDYNNYGVIEGMKPGRGVSSTNVKVQYQNSWKRFSYDASFSFNYESTMLYNIFGDLMPDDTFVYSAIWDTESPSNPDSIMMVEGVFQTQSWQNYNISGVLKLSYDYEAGSLGKGNILLGGQYDYFNLHYNDFTIGDIYDCVRYKGVNQWSSLIKNNHEDNYSIYTQLKHSFNNHFILNIGLRYDNKNRYIGLSHKVFSPRAAVIWKPASNSAFKASYSRSFVDAPYFYRASTRIYTGNEDLTPQFLDNFQLTGILRFPSINLEYEGNLFYNNVKDIIILNDYSYTNAGIVKAVGMEHILTFRNDSHLLRATLYAHKVISSDGYSATDNEIYSIPNYTVHLLASKRLFHNFWLMSNFSFTSKCHFMLPDYIFMQGEYVGGTIRELPSCFLADLGFSYKWQMFELNVKCKNLFNNQYRLGGDRVPVLQEGRSLLATLSLTLSD